MIKPVLSVTREKHLDHLVRVIPFIVMLYAVQSYFLMRLAPAGMGSDNVIFLGLALALTISGFIVYNLKHRTDFFEEHMIISFLGRQQQLTYQDIKEVRIPDEAQSFATISITTHRGQQFRIYFADDAVKIKAWIESKKSSWSAAA
jgi:hypothetical protein